MIAAIYARKSTVALLVGVLFVWGVTRGVEGRRELDERLASRGTGET